MKLRKGILLWQEGEPSTRVVYVIRGRLLIYRSGIDGNTVFFGISRDGDLIGCSSLAAWLGDSGTEPIAPTHHVTVTARVETFVLTMSNAIVQQLLDREPLLVRRIIRELCRLSHILADEIFNERTQSGKLLLATKLLRMAAMEGRRTGEAHLDYSQTELMGFTGLCSRNINKYLGELPALRTDNGRRGVQIERIETLRAFVRAAERDP